MPRSVLLGRVVADGEPLWLPEDLEAALEWRAHLDSQCSGCGHPASQTFNPDFEGAFEAEPVVCHACKKRELEYKKFDDTSGLKVAVKLSDDAQQDLREQHG